MQYLTQANEIKVQIAKFSLAKVLWLDTEDATMVEVETASS